jgi:hypothetical protein
MKRIIYVICVMLIVSSCQPEQVETNNNTGPSTYFISFEIDGVAEIEENGVDGYQMGYSNGSSISGVNNTISADPGTGFYNFQDEQQPNSGISFMNNNFVLSEYSNDNAAALETIFTLGSHSYSLNGNSAEGVQFNYSENSVLWSTDELAQPSNSNFIVTESIASTDQLGADQREVKGTFNCELFNEAGASRIISNGQFYLIFTAP